MKGTETLTQPNRTRSYYKQILLLNLHPYVLKIYIVVVSFYMLLLSPYVPHASPTDSMIKTSMLLWRVPA
jgi:hypothetical protein